MSKARLIRIRASTSEGRNSKVYSNGDKATININMKGHSTKKAISKAKVRSYLSYIGKLWQRGKGLYIGDFSNGNKHGKG